MSRSEENPHNPHPTHAAHGPDRPLDSRGSRALLTGCHGFTGRYVAAELEAAGYEVIGLAHDGDPPEAGVLRANLLDRAAVQRVVAEARADVVVHLAAIAFVAHGDVDEIYRTNIVGTRNLLSALAEAEHEPRSVVLASSANIYGNAEVEPIVEDIQPAPANDYAVSKLAMEYMARLWMERLPITLVRPFNYTGVGQSENFLIPKIVQHFKRGEKVIELGNTDVARDFSDVRDVARAYAAIVEKAPAGETVNVCSGAAHTLGEVLEMMARIAGYAIEVRVNPAFVRNNEVKRLVGSNARLHALTGFAPSILLEETLRWTYKESREAL
ncbi:MAG: NAD-dependent epimerase/dehydratase family protein [Rhodanobacteraceae bacterium]|nr:MAG: NAD-dependent epimerase/dehydratase family protein [Rhodanobacteraceae bacterium]